MMKRICLKALFSFCVLLCVSAQAQNPSLAEVMAAEKSFAAYSVAHGTKAAFLKYADSTALVFEQGKAVNAVETWTRKESGQGVLNWEPWLGGIAASGDLGFTSGPWTFQPKTANDSIVARGQYATVWKKNAAGDWKFLLDLGVSKTPSFEDVAYALVESKNGFVKGTWNNLLNREQKFIRQMAEAGIDARLAAYKSAVSNRAFFLNRNGQLPAKYDTEIEAALKRMPTKISFTISGSGISAAGDLGYVYGTTVVEGKTENYLRVWQREGKEWRLALEVLRY